ncbi:uncharacterized protein LOC128891900 [Hylaeus anthracinus]|uniref:uncharacterized protein LOC128880714 n=1 Tax=Hylaeus volcanicus TaxID=313075 RepID=UPI0023B872FD|nr:uncharacterized protein LOC128880714 [Hylaeus volcanicus]XP_054007806.1 uncharacterized protein LOC128891900 [Hylaeus anthracinus]
MGSDSEVPEDEEEILVYVEFEGLVDDNVFSEEQLQLDMIGIDTDHPIMQINGKFYEGTYEDVCGTYMFFMKSDNSTVEDPVFDVPSNLKYFGKTRKFLKMQRIFLKPRTEVLGDSKHPKCIPNLNTVKEAGVPGRYQTEALSFWKTLRNNRLHALQSYLEKQRIRQQKKSQGLTLESESDEDNPFAVYRHKEELDKTNEPEDVRYRSEEESSYCDDELYSKFKFPKGIANETIDTAEDSCEKNLKELENLLESESSIVKDGGSSSVRSVKAYKTRTFRKKNTGKAIQRIKNKKTQISLKDKNISLDKKDRESLNMKETLDEMNRSDNTETLDTLDIAKDENEALIDEHEAKLIEKSEAEINQADSTNCKTVKLLKREAKMKEILEKLKAMAKEHTNATKD